MPTQTPSPTATHEFRAEIKQLLDILIHSVYTSKDIFIRELISNATDALEKVRFTQASGQPLHSPDLPLEIRIETKSEGTPKVLIISDTGIGMTEEEVHANIGTIAHSGATAFLKQIGQADDESKKLSLIGRFGVGFYSVFMAADRVTITTRSAQPDAKPVVWTSDGAGSYTVETLADDIPRGTRIEIELKADDTEFAEKFAIQGAIKRYSNFVPFPIFVDGERVNQTTALWREPESQIKPEQYNEFFKLISHDYEDPILHLHYSVDAPIQYSALLFVPSSNPEALGFGQTEVSLQLYVKRVLIDGDNKNLLPPYLRFVKGVVESDDLPLNVSRETLQQNRIVVKIRDGLTRRLLDLLLDLAKKDAVKYQKFWETFGRILKEGYNDYANREKIQDLLRFRTSRAGAADDWISLAQYVDAMRPGQKAIYYLSGPTRESLARDPRLELFRKNGIEVLYLDEIADEFVLAGLGAYHEKPLVSADQVKAEDLKELGEPAKDEEKKEIEKSDSDIQPVLDRFKEILGDRVVDVRLSQRLVDSPACLVNEDGGQSAHMERVMRMMQKSTDLPRRVMELNAQHPLLKNLAKLVAGNPQDPFVARACEQLFEGCMLLDGYLTDPHELVQRMNDVLGDAASLKAQR